MNSYRIVRGAFVALATLGMMTAQVFGREESDQHLNESVIDVSLQSGGVLQGQVVSAQGAALSNIEVFIASRGRLIARAVSDKDGYFSVSEIRGGTYVLRVADEVTTCRIWTANTAPPSASQAVLLVTGSATRAQLGLVRRYGPGSLIVIGGAVTMIVLAATDEAS